MPLPPGLDGYMATRQAQAQDQMQQMQMIQGLMQMQGQAADRQQKAELFPLQKREMEAKLKKMDDDAAMTASLGPLMASGQLGPDQLDALGAKLAFGGHPGAATVMKIADQRRQLMQNQQALTGMQSQPGVTPNTPNDDNGNPMPSMPAQPGVFAPLFNSKFVGPQAQAYQQQINSGAAGLTPQQVNSHLDRLTQMDVSGQARDSTQAAINARQDKAQTNRIEIRNMFPPASARPNVGGDASGELTKDAIHDLAVQSLYNPQVLVGFNRDTRTRKLIQNEATRVAQESGATPNDVVSGRAGFKADSTSLNKLTPQYDAVVAFEKTAIRNGDVLLKLADKVDSTGVPILEKWIRAGRQATGDSDVAKFNAQIQVYRTEAAKILTNPNLTGQLTDSARKEVEHFLSGSASAGQIREVVNLLKTDFENRKGTLEDQIGAIRERMKGRMVGPDSEKPSMAPKVSPASRPPLSSFNK